MISAWGAYAVHPAIEAGPSAVGALGHNLGRDHMIRTMSAAVAVAMLVAGAASAGDVKGTIKAMDVAKKTVTLDTGTVYTFPSPNAFAGLSTGQTVIISFTAAGATNNAESARIYTK